MDSTPPDRTQQAFDSPSSSPAPSSPFGRGWIPAGRDIGLPGEGLHSPLPFRGGGGGGVSLHAPCPEDEPLPNPSPHGKGPCAPTPVLQYRHDGWTAERRVRFLDALATCGCVRSACAHVGLSWQSAYLLRRRDALFAAGWDGALVRARDLAEDVLMARALNGVTETVYYRGEAVGSRTRFDSRLLLALLARLDGRASDEEAQGAATHFDALLAALAQGGSLPPGEAWEPPLSRDEQAAAAAEEAYPLGFGSAWPDEAELARRDRRAVRLRRKAEAEWDKAQARDLAAVDAACAGRAGAVEDAAAGECAAPGAAVAGDPPVLPDPPPIEYKSLDGPGRGPGVPFAGDRQHRQLRPGAAGGGGADGRRADGGRARIGGGRLPCGAPARMIACGRRGKTAQATRRNPMNRTILIAAPLALAGAGALGTAPALAQTMLKATLSGAAEVPGPGMDGAAGQATVAVYPERGYVCWSLGVTGAGEPTMAHIHKGAAGVAGGVVVPLEAPASGTSQGCAPVDKAAAADIAANPAGYYVNVHNAAFPKGALRGQLGM